MPVRCPSRRSRHFEDWHVLSCRERASHWSAQLPFRVSRPIAITGTRTSPAAEEALKAGRHRYHTALSGPRCRSLKAMEGINPIVGNCIGHRSAEEDADLDCIRRRQERWFDKVNIVLVGKYTSLQDSYMSVVKALEHAAMRCQRKLVLEVSITY